jgi:hypothetical protein
VQLPIRTKVQELEFQVEGDIVYSTELRRQHPSPAERIRWPRKFIVARKGAQWKIRTTNVNPDDPGFIEFNETGCNGKTVFELQQMDENRVTQKHPEKDVFSVLGRVRNGNFPMGLISDLIYPLWLVYCSSDYLSPQKAERLPAPFFNTSDFLTQAAPPMPLLSAKWKTNGSSFLSESTWYSDGTCSAEENGVCRFEKYSPPFDAGFVRASLETTDWVHFSGMPVPGEFSLKVFAPNWPEAGEPKCVIRYTIEAKVQTVQPLQNFAWLPELQRKTLITDTRYRLVHGCGCLSYGSSAGWNTEEEIEAKLKSRGLEYEKQN